MKHDNLKERTRQFALSIIRFVDSLPRDRVSDILSRQLLRSGTSVGANYRAACRAKSPADFVAKLGTVEEEADESGFWLDLLVDAGRAPLERSAPLSREAGELCAIMVASIVTARRSGLRRDQGQTEPMGSGAHSSLPPTPEDSQGRAALRTPHSALG